MKRHAKEGGGGDCSHADPCPVHHAPCPPFFVMRSCSLTVYDGDECGIRYKLLGVVEHQGRMTSGHYVSHVRVRCLAAIVDLCLCARQGDAQRDAHPHPRPHACQACAVDANGNPEDDEWYSISDRQTRKVRRAAAERGPGAHGRHVAAPHARCCCPPPLPSQTTAKAVLGSQAYILFYERMP